MRKQLIRSVILGGTIFLGTQSLRSAPPATATLRVEIAPMGYLEVVPAPQGSETAGVRTFSIPLKVMIRLNPATTGELSISRAAEVGSESSALEIETQEGSRPISESPIAIRPFSRSGTYNDPVVIVRSGAAGSASQPVRLVLTLSSSDGAIAVSQIFTIPPPVLPATSVLIPPAH